MELAGSYKTEYSGVRPPAMIDDHGSWNYLGEPRIKYPKIRRPSKATLLRHLLSNLLRR